MSDQLHHGRCVCGRIQCHIANDPIWIGHCHCQSCRRNTGAALATFVGVAEEKYFVDRGEPASYESSPGVRRRFCGDCGTPLTYASDRFPGEVHLYISTLDEPDWFPPSFHVFCGEKIGWFETSDDLPRHLV